MTQSNRISRNELRQHMQDKHLAYQNLTQGSSVLLAAGTLFWTEQLLLRLVAWLAQQRLDQLIEVLDSE